MPDNLGLDEALVTVSQSSQDAIDIFYQIDECYGCPLEKLASVGPLTSQSFVIGTYHSLQLELRSSETADQMCRLTGLSLNNHAHYLLKVANESLLEDRQQAAINRTGLSSIRNCTLETVEAGDCGLCPFAILLFFACVLIAIEKALSMFSEWTENRRGSCNRQQSAGDHESAQGEDEDGHPQSDRPLRSTSSSETSEVQRKHLAMGRPECVTTGRRRVECLDTFRGLTIAGMIMVNYGGAGYSWLEHSAWDGLTSADFVFPFFVFTVGASIPLSSKSLERRSKTFWQINAKIFKRAAILILIGLCLNTKRLGLSGKGLANLRLSGVLQRIAISYLVGALIYNLEILVEQKIKDRGYFGLPCVTKLIRGLLECIAGLIAAAIYIYITFFLEYDQDCPAGYTGPGGLTEGGRFMNCTGGAASWLDHKVLGENHMYNDTSLSSIFKTKVMHDPEGLLGYSTSILLTLVGLQCGKILLVDDPTNTRNNHGARFALLATWTILMVGSAIVTSMFVPINKKLWSASFVAVTGATSFGIMSFLYALMDMYHIQNNLILMTLSSAGKNSLLLYIGHSLISAPWIFAIDPSSHLQLLGKLCWSTLFWLLIARFLAAKQIFMKV